MSKWQDLKKRKKRKNNNNNNNKKQTNKKRLTFYNLRTCFSSISWDCRYFLVVYDTNFLRKVYVKNESQKIGA